MEFTADFDYAVPINAESIIVKGNLIHAITVMDKLHLVHHVFRATQTVTAAKHPNGATEVTPKHASPAADQGENDFAVMFEVLQWQKVMGGKWEAVKVFYEGSVWVAYGFFAVSVCDA